MSESPSEFRATVEVSIEAHKCLVEITAPTLKELFEKAAEVVAAADKYQKDHPSASGVV